MEQGVATTAARDVDIVPGKDLEDFVTFFINNQMFGIPVLKVQDILTPDRIAPIPLTPPEVRGSINLRGRIVTVIDVRVCLGLENRSPAGNGSGRPEGASRRTAKDSGPADNHARPAQEENPDEASRPADEGNGAADTEGAPADTDAGERPATDETSPAGGASPMAGTDTGTVGDHGMCVTVEHQNELYTLLVDRVGDVISLSDEFYEGNPSTLDPVWREFALGVYRLESALMVVLDVGRLLDIKICRE